MNAVDLTASIVPRSDQLNAEDLLAGPRTVTITAVRRGSAEQPVDIHLAEFDRPFKPSKTVRRILVAAWGPDAATYVGRRMTIYRDPAVKWGGMDVGGIRISHLSHIDRRMTVALTVTRGKRAPYVVEPLPAAPPQPPAPEPVAAADERDPGERPTPSAADYVEEICDPRTSFARIRDIYAECKGLGLLTALVLNETGDDEQLEQLLMRMGNARQADSAAGAS